MTLYNYVLRLARFPIIADYALILHVLLHGITQHLFLVLFALNKVYD